jgi:uncharacterized membrane protein YdjX (TVP38/TMEM64 family)
VHRQLSWAALAANQALLQDWATAHAFLAPLIAVLVFAGVAALSVPGAALVVVAYGVLFGMLAGTVISVVGATIGGVAAFLAARHALAEVIERRFGAIAARLRPGLERDGFSYMLAIRLSSLFPFGIVNLVAGLAGMRLVPFVVATFLGIIPSVLVYASLGAGIGGALAVGQEPDLRVILSPTILLPLLGLACLSLLPVIWRRFRRA